MGTTSERGEILLAKGAQRGSGPRFARNDGSETEEVRNAAQSSDRADREIDYVCYLHRLFLQEGFAVLHTD